LSSKPFTLLIFSSRHCQYGNTGNKKPAIESFSISGVILLGVLLLGFEYSRQIGIRYGEKAAIAIVPLTSLWAAGGNKPVLITLGAGQAQPAEIRPQHICDGRALN